MISVEQLSVKAGDFRIDGISFEVPTGEYGVLMGRTGCGKTTILEAICGLKEVVSGKITLMGREVTNLRAGERGIGFVPQDGALFSTMTVRQQLSFGPKVQGWRKEEIEKRVLELVEELGIEDILERKPFGLSGGERQRVALGRALAVRPEILCLDEPLSALDEATHEGMVELIRSVVKEHGITALHITHSRREADLIADREFFLEDGKLVEGS
ncbi:MAG: ATP-binding cassette domain-containing protein [Verrucomicrobia bacterium]|nr:ATP-binding cassette domain-containing protein [Verrucomicrobiota bacterium]